MPACTVTLVFPARMDSRTDTKVVTDTHTRIYSVTFNTRQCVIQYNSITLRRIFRASWKQEEEGEEAGQ